MSERRLVVLQSVPTPAPTTNPYVTQLLHALAGPVDVQTFTWRRALAGRFDVFHVHWPERLLRGTAPWRSAARLVLFALLLARLRWQRRPIVRTLHNERPHEAGHRVETWLLRRADRQTTAWIALNDHSRPPAPGPMTVIPHGHYCDWLATLAEPAPPPVTGRLLFFGLLRRYKGVTELMAAFAGLADPRATLRVVGRAMDDKAAAAIDSAGADPRVSARLEYVPDADLVEEIGRAQLVVLPYRALHNSGAALLALSVGRPILVPANAVTDALADEVGAGWVHRYRGHLHAAVLSDALAATIGPQSGRPDLARRAWPAAATAHAEVYRSAVELCGDRHGKGR